ncbi:MAG: hypothetical protein NTW07_11065 [candidate division Zixibacteria bacterium]|nr:hypothetical protein [candidate division Zixibacteria bacterium]
MIPTLRLVATILALTPVVIAGRFVRIAGEVELPLPDNWRLTTDTAVLPAQLVCDNDPAEILVFQSEIADDDLIADQSQLKKSVDLVIKEVISTLPEGQLRVSTGFYEGTRAGFVLEFASTDSASGLPLEHTLKGIIYRISPMRQRLYTVWGKATAAVFPQVKASIRLVQDGFAYRGAQEPEVFVASSISYWWLVPLALAIGGLLLLRSARRKPNAQAANIRR